eukprot:2499158-Ditylum_brightwellii.AAC.1
MSMGPWGSTGDCKGTRQLIVVNVFGWTWLVADNSDSDNDDDDAYGTKNGANALFHCKPPPVLNDNENMNSNYILAD